MESDEERNLKNKKLENEIELQNIDIRERNKPKDKFFHRLEPAKEWGQTIATLFLGVVGIMFTFSTSNNQERNGKMMMATSLMSSREQSETQFRQSMFKPMINQILSDTLPLKKRISVLELFENNFNDIFHSRSLYDVLWDTVIKQHDTELRDRLIKLARYIASVQELEISQMEFHKTLAKNNTFDSAFCDEGNEEFNIQLISIEKFHVSIKITFWCNDQNKERREIRIKNGRPINLTYFDTPLTNNFVMPDGDRIAIVLNDIIIRDGIADSARLDVVHFPADYVTTGFRPSVNKVNDILNQKD
jgi:hypothetical protein